VRVDPAVARGWFLSAPIARMATVTSDGAPHLVVVCFAPVADRFATIIDHKPKRPGVLQRVDNILHEPRVSLIVDHYEDDWRGLWWVRLDATAGIVDAAAREFAVAVAALRARYPQYRHVRLGGPLIMITPVRWSGWRAS
jgi:PPOX class probable F420-dependent enzyme